MPRHSGSSREWTWARSQGFVGGTVAGASARGAVDLLADARNLWGNAVLRGATVSTVRGYLRPDVAAGQRVSGISAVRVCELNDIGEVTTNVEETPFGQGRYWDWLGFWPYDAASDGAVPLESQSIHAATFSPGSYWYVEAHSSRRMPDLGLTVGLFFYHTSVNSAAGADVGSISYDLSVGLKLA